MSFSSVSTSSLIGVAIACSGNILISLALTVQKLAHRRQNEELAASRSQSSSEGSTPYRDQEDSGHNEQPQSHSRSESASSQDTETDERTLVPVLVVPPGSSNSSSSSTIKPGSPLPVVVDSIDLERTKSSEGERENGHERGNGPKKPWSGRIEVPEGYKTNIRIHSSPMENKSKSPREERGKSGNEDEGSTEVEEGSTEVEEGMYLKSRLWWLGMILIAVGEGGNFLSYGFAPASVVAPLGTVALIANCIFAPLILKETFHAKELIGMGLAILGAVTVVWSSNASNPRLDPDSLVSAIKQIPFIVYTCLNVALMILLVLLSRSHRFGQRYIAIDVGVCALFGGYTVLSTKALSSLLSTMFLKATEYWITWVLVLVLVVTSILQVKYLNRALMRFQSKEVIPTQFVFFSMAAIIGSAVLYQEFRDATFSRFVNFAFGIATTFLGVHLLTSFSEPEDDSHNDDTSSPQQSAPAGPQRATSSASLNLLLPTTSRLSERTPLLIPITESPQGAIPQNLVGSDSVVHRRLLNRTSTGNLTPGLGLGSQAGFLLMATTPPAGHGSMPRRERASSRSHVPQIVPESDEESRTDRGGR